MAWGAWNEPGPKPHWRILMPGRSKRSRRACTSGVTEPRSSAISGRPPSSSSMASRSSSPGVRAQTPSRAVSAPAGTSQAFRKPMKWSMRIASKSSIWRRMRARHQPNPSARWARQS